jgi:arylsulfatase A-like enzyme
MCARRRAPTVLDVDEEITRRSLLARGALAAVSVGALGSAGDTAQAAARLVRSSRRAARGAPNLLVIIVDQLRQPQWWQATPAAAALMPNLAALRRGAVSFDSHYTAANDCTPARGTMLTGLYSHQTGCLVTGGSTLAPAFPTWGTLLRGHGYRTAYFGKWHLTSHDNRWTVAHNAHALEPYGFDGGTYPSPDGAPGQGAASDPQIARQFASWLASSSGKQPWCTTVSLVNPHDIAWWYRWSNHTVSERSAPNVVSTLPPNFETPAQLAAQRKPRLQLSLQETAASGFGAVPFTGPGVKSAWLRFENLYLKLSHDVDAQIGVVLAALHSRPSVAANTIVVFTSDHGEYGASHGLRGKGGGAYEEALRVPLIVRDLRANPVTRAPDLARTGLTSSVDLAPLLLTLATGSNAWRSDAALAHLAGRHDIARMLADPSAPGRPFVLHATDEIVSEFATEPYAYNAPLHVTAIRTPHAKYAVYSNWKPKHNVAQTAGAERELYDYGTAAGRLEIANLAGRSPLEAQLDAQLTAAIRDELRRPLQAHLRAAQVDGYNDYYTTAQSTALSQTRQRRQLEKDDPAGAAEKLGAQ